MKTLMATAIRIITGVHQIPEDICPKGPTIFFSNHSSHLDFLTIWAALPSNLRQRTRPVAGRDYWEKGAIRKHLANKVFNAVLIERQNVSLSNNPLTKMLEALDQEFSLIVFPEGTRSLDGEIGEFKSGLYHLAKARPKIPLLPIFLQNMSRILPKGDIFPVPIIAGLKMGKPINLEQGEKKGDFLLKARVSLTDLNT